MTGRDSTAGPRLLPLPVAPRSSAEEILEVLHAAYGREARLLRGDSFPPLERTVEGVEGAATRFFGLRRQGRLAAVAEIAGLGEDRRGIWSFVVHPDFFRQGLGSRLLKLLLERFRGSALEVSTARASTARYSARAPSTSPVVCRQ